MGKRGRLGTVRRKPRSEQPQARDAPPKNVTRYEDVADSEDEFFINKDKVLLDGLNAQRPDDDVLDFSDEEVLRDAVDDTDDEGSEEEEDDEDYEDGDDGDNARARTESPERSATGKEDEEDEALETWGRSRRDYYNQDEIETEGDALEEEEEARRLQQKRLRGKSEADFGLDDDWLDTKAQSGEPLADGHGDGAATTEVLPEVEITDSMGLDERLQLLDTRYPEFGPLSKEFIRLQPLHASLSEARLRQAKATQAGDSRGLPATSQQGSPTLSVANLKYQALTAYLGALSMYFALLTAPSDTNEKTTVAISPSDLREHAIMDSLVTCRQIWEEVKDIPLPDAKEPPRIHSVGADKTSNTHAGPKETAPRAAKGRAQRRKELQMQKQQAALAAAHAEAEKQLDEEIRRTEEELAKIANRARSKPASTENRDAHSANGLADDESDHREGTSLDPLEAAEKARRKKTLRFYTSQIAQKANRRNTAGKDAGGDADIPYRERLKDRQARLNAQAEKRRDRSPRDKLAALSDAHSDEERQDRREADNESEDDYYDMVAAATKKRKIAKKGLDSASRAGETGRKGGLHGDAEEELGPDNKRAIGYMIEKNKGLTPRRKKEVRNPRVKKRKKYAEKQKKLGSVRQVYKGGEERGGYSGEATGIKTGLVKSIKL